MISVKKVCIHGHFYQPPRIDPWLGELLPEGSAAPGLNWNQRILESSYAPLAWARRRNGQGLITDIVNCYEWISFNFGPTLLSWLETADPECYARILAADQASIRRWGRGNAMAQCHHHLIMPLASPLDKEVQLAWTKADFQTRFSRDPEGLWLSEAAVDTATLEAVAKAGFRYVVLAPRQAAAVADMDGRDRHGVDESNLDIQQPYAVVLPSGQSIAVFFYHGPLSQAVAFERLLENGENFWQRLAGAAGPGLLCLATDGETYGHHFAFGEMALAYVLEQAALGRDGLELTNFAAYLAHNPPVKRVFLHEPSSWSCVHGVERWRANCGCTDGGHPGWQQRWRAPLRQALENNKRKIDTHFFVAGKEIFLDPHKALLDYGRLLAKGVDQNEFIRVHFLPTPAPRSRQRGFDLLAMQEWAMCSLASCAWFFDEISRVEPLNAMTYALRAMELARATGGEDFFEEWATLLTQAESNLPGKGNGADLWRSHVRPRSMNLAAWLTLGLLLIEAQGQIHDAREHLLDWPGLKLSLTIDHAEEQAWSGKGVVVHPREGRGESFAWRWSQPPTSRPWADEVRVRVDGHDEENVFVARDLAWNRKELVTLAWLARQENQWWEQQQRFAALAPAFFLPWQEDQYGQNQEHSWRAHLPGLAWAFVLDSQPIAEPGEFLEFVREYWQHCPLFDARISQHLLELLRQAQPDWTALAKIMERIHALGVPVNLWAVENRLWTMGLARPEVHELAQRLWFRV